MLKRFGLAAVTVALLAAIACGGGGGTKAVVFTVEVDGKTTFAASFIAYFPNDVQAHPGDTVDFHNNFSGEPHSVTLGTDVDDVFSVIAQACPNGGLADPDCQEGPPEQYADQYNAADAKLPLLIPDDPTQPISQAAAQPCYLATGDAPTDNSACSADQMTQPDFDGTQTFYNSGYLADDGEVFAVKLSDDIAPGVYNYYCLLHREGMSGTITVVAKDTGVPKPEDQAAAGDQALADVVAKLQPAVDDMASLTADTALAGNFSEDAPEAEINEFGPSDITISAGDAVTWTVLGPHSIAFNATEDARPILAKGSDGTVSLNTKAATPAPEGAPGQTPPGPDSPPVEEPTLIDAGEWDGQGFHSSGLILSFGPGDPGYSAYKLTFTTAGTYTYICTVHPDMEGTVTVQ